MRFIKFHQFGAGDGAVLVNAELVATVWPVGDHAALQFQEFVESSPNEIEVKESFELVEELLK